MNKEINFSGLKALFLNCSLKKRSRMSHTSAMMGISRKIMKAHGVKSEEIRIADHQIPAGVYPDMTEYGYEKDEWNKIHKKVMATDILVLGSPIWLGELSSMAKKVVERLYSHSSETNDKGQFIYYGKVGGCVITGNEDGVKHCSMYLLYALHHMGFTIPPQVDSGWIGEVGPGPSYMDPESGGPENDFTNRTITFLSYNLMHMAQLLKNNNGLPTYGNNIDDWKKGERYKFPYAKQ